MLDLAELEPAGDLSLTRLAAVAGLGPRALQRNFREYVGVSPRDYVEWVRLGRAHNDLVAGAGGTVAEIAFRWGFTHVPRFAGAYQERYGVAEEAGTLDPLSGGRFELSLGRGIPGEAQVAMGRNVSDDDLRPSSGRAGPSRPTPRV